MLNSRGIINFSKTRQGRFLLFLLLFVAVLAIVAVGTGPAPTPAAKLIQGHAPPLQSRVVVTQKEVSPYHQIHAAVEVTGVAADVGDGAMAAAARLPLAPRQKRLAPMLLYAAAPTAPTAPGVGTLLNSATAVLPAALTPKLAAPDNTAAAAPAGDVYAPYGRLITCQLVNTVDTASALTPIIALVLKDLWHDGKLVIPAGAEVHGTAQRAPLRDRVIGGHRWVVVWRTADDDNGRELVVSGIALACSKVTDADAWALTDGSVGIPGRVIETADYAVVRKLAADLLAGGAEAATGKTVTLTASGSGTEFADDAKAIVANAVNRAADEYARSIIATVARDGSYVRCAAGTVFYLYVTQTIRKDTALIAATEDRLQ